MQAALRSALRTMCGNPLYWHSFMQSRQSAVQNRRNCLLYTSPVNTIIELDDREFRVDSVDFGNGTVSLQDIDVYKRQGWLPYPVPTLL